MKCFREVMAGISICLLIPALQVNGQVPVTLGTKTPYVFSNSVSPVLPPAGYKPVFINYVGRHGARFLTKAGPDVHVLDVLSAAEKNSGLSSQGKALKILAGQLLAAGGLDYENITLSGALEQQQIGARMLKNNSSAFRGFGLDVITTRKVRTKQSADAFLRAFVGMKEPLRMIPVSDSTDAFCRFYDLSPAYLQFKKSFAVRGPMDSLMADPRMSETAKRICRKVFTGAYGDSVIGSGGAISFAEDCYDLYAIQFSMSGEMKAKGFPVSDVWTRIFEERDLQWLSFLNGAADFLEKGPGTDSMGIQVRIAVPLLVDFIRAMDEAVHFQGGGQVDARLRFTHAEAIAPFAALLGIGGASQSVSSIFEYRKKWRAEEVIPLSANIQWVLYRKGDELLVKVLLNEREAVLPVASDCFPYYRWEDVKAYYMRKLKGLQVGLGDDMVGYLREVK